MWISMTDSFVSIVRYIPGDEDQRTSHLLVRARLAGDLQRLLGPDAVVAETSAADYRFRSIVHEDALFAALVRRVTGIAYANFKNAVDEQPRSQDPYRDVRHRAYGRVWSVMADAQSALHGAPWSGRYGRGSGPDPRALDREVNGLDTLSAEELALGWPECEDCGEVPGFCQCYQGAGGAGEGR